MHVLSKNKNILCLYNTVRILSCFLERNLERILIKIDKMSLII